MSASTAATVNNMFPSPSQLLAVKEGPRFFVKAKKQMTSEKDEPGFLSQKEAEAFWKKTNPQPFPKKLRSSPRSAETIIASLGPLKKDVSDLVLTTLFSDVFQTAHASMYGSEAHHVFRMRTTQPSGNAPDSKENPAAPKTNKKIEQPTGTKSQLAFLIRKGILPKSDNPVFTEMFPGTDLPHLHFVNGLPRANKTTFNALLVSRLRACKTALALKATDRLSKDLVVHVSRLIDKSMIKCYNDKKMKKTAPKVSSPRPPTTKDSTSAVQVKDVKPKKKNVKKEKETPRSIDFVSSTTPTPDPQQPSTSTLEVKYEPAPPSQQPIGFASFSTAHLTPNDVLERHRMHQKLWSYFSGPNKGRQRLTQTEKQILAKLSLGFIFQCMPSGVCDSDPLECIANATRILSSALNDKLVPFINNDDLISIPQNFVDSSDFYDLYRSTATARIDSFVQTLEIAVMELRSI
jgi:hypothetical protein